MWFNVLGLTESDFSAEVDWGDGSGRESVAIRAIAQEPPERVEGPPAPPLAGFRTCAV